MVDTSALVSVVRGEQFASWLSQRLMDSEAKLVGAPTVVELGIVLGARSSVPDLYQRVVRDAELEVVPFDTTLAERAVGAWRRFGKGRHPAGLNFGDCCVYAVAEQFDLPILCVGEDFARTDLEVIRPS